MPHPPRDRASLPPPDLPSAITRYRAPLLRTIEAALPPSNDPLEQVLRYHLGLAEPDGSVSRGGNTGKTFRSALCLFTCEAFSNTWNPALPWAVALELVHNFSLVHDDIQDEDLERRHRSTVWAIWGKPRALWAGDALHVRACAPAWKALQRTGCSSHAEACGLVCSASLEMIQGQIRDIEFEARETVETTEYLEMIASKTGALVRCAMEVGAVMGGASPEARAAARRCGASLGRLFQVRDDILGIWGDAARTGKSSDNDIRRHKKTYPIVYAAHASPEVRSVIARAYQAPSEDDRAVEAVVSALEAVDARGHSQRVAEAAAEEALSGFRSAVHAEGPRRDLEHLVRFLLTREF